MIHRLLRWVARSSLGLTSYGCVFVSIGILSIPARSQNLQTERPQATTEQVRLSGRDQRGSCFRGRPLSECRSFWITEATVGLNLYPESQIGGSNLVAGIEVGWMRNRSNDNALGGIVGVTAVSQGLDDFFVSLGPRYRRWLSSSMSLDVGLAVAWTPGRVEIAETYVSFMYRDLVGVWIKPAYDFGRGNSNFSAGMKVGSTPGVISYALGTAAVVLYVIALSSSAD